MTIRFTEPTPDPPPALATAVGYGRHVRWRDVTACRLTYDDDPPEHITVTVVTKRRLHVVTDAMLQAQRDMDILPYGRTAGLHLSLYPM